MGEPREPDPPHGRSDLTHRIPGWARLTGPLLLLAISTGCGLAIAEVGLRLAGFSYRTIPTVQFGWPEPEVIAESFVADRDLFWVPHDYAVRLSEARQLQPAIVFLGDSCTQFGTYPRLTLERLRAAAPGLARGVKLGVAGWSTAQGLTQLQRDILPLHPRVVTIYFGWNDHWVALGPTDAEARPSASAWWLSQHCRLYQLVMKARVGMTRLDLRGRPNRVPLPEYESNLRQMAGDARAAGVRVVFITAPSAHRPGREPAYLAHRHVRDLRELVPLHDSYLEATRRAARGSTLCDAARSFAALPPPASRYFMKDGVHLAREGNERLADLLARCIVAAASGADSVLE